MADLLLVDNDRRIVDLAAWFLERRGFTVRSVLSYREARVAIRERVPDLMLADLELGDESGREELPRLEREGLLPRTLVVSGFLDAALDAELRSIELVIDTLAKPYDMDRLEASIRACLAGADPAAGAGADADATAEDAGGASVDPEGRADEDRALRDVQLTPQAPPAPAASTARPTHTAHSPSASLAGDRESRDSTSISRPASDPGPAAAPAPARPADHAAPQDDDDDDWIEITPRSRPEAGA